MKHSRLIPRLRHSADLRALCFLALTLFLLGGNWCGWLPGPISWLASAFLAFICCVIAHNHMHLPIFRGTVWNSLFQLALMFGSGQPPTGIITAHNERHHQSPDSGNDFVRTSLVRSRSNALNLIAFPFLSIITMIREKPNDLVRWKCARPRLYRQALLERSVFYGVLIVLVIADWRATLIFLVLPWLIAQLVLVGVNLLQHQDCDTTSEYDHSRNVTGGLINFFLLNNGYHTAHHLRPAMHWSLLPEFHRNHVLPRINPILNHRTFTGLVIERLLRPPVSHAS